MSRRVSLGALSTDAAASTQLRAPILIPAGSVPRRPPLKSAKLSQAVLDYLKLGGVLALIVVTGLAIAAGGFILLLVQT